MTCLRKIANSRDTPLSYNGDCFAEGWQAAKRAKRDMAISNFLMAYN